ncbi:MAG: hypothetical protein OXC71_10775 [Chloroflexi bacterium]|nr:hypothetical protein [Chloroflexota bacterium]
MPTFIHIVLLVIVFMTSLVLTNGVALAEEDARETVTTRLEPGWNLVGWTGDEVAVASIFWEIPSLQVVYAWDAREQRYLAAVGRTDPVSSGLDVRGDLEQLRAGMGLWLFIGGLKPVSWTRELSKQSAFVTVHEGWNLVTWGGAAGEAVSSAKGLGGTFMSALGWDPDAQAFEVCARDEPCHAPNLSALGTGDALWIKASLQAAQPARRWWHRVPIGFEFGSDVTPTEQRELRTEVDEALAFVLRQYGILVPDLTLKVGNAAGTLCGYANKTIYLAEPCRGALLHELAHAVQEYLGTRTNSDRWGNLQTTSLAPDWLDEGGANYLGSLVEHSLNRKDFEERYQEAAQASRWTNKTLRQIERDILKGDSAAHYELATFAVMFLADQAGDQAVLAFYDQRQSFSTWEDTFRRVFGMATYEFYDAFAAHRAEVAPTYPLVRGIVLDHTGQPLEGIGVWTVSDELEATFEETDVSGMFSVPALGSVRLWLKSGSCELGGYDGESGFTPERSEVMPFQVEDRDATVLTITLPIPLSEFCQKIAGIVAGLDGEPLPGVWVSLNPRTSQGAYVGQHTRATGQFEFSGRPGSYDLSLFTAAVSKCDVSGYAGGRVGEQAVVLVGEADITGLQVIGGGEPLDSVGFIACQFAGPQSPTHP